MSYTNRFYTFIIAALGSVYLFSCSPTALQEKRDRLTIPPINISNTEGATAPLHWKDAFADPHLVALIDTALAHNQELNIMLLEIEMSKNEIQAKRGEYLPSVALGGGMGVEKAARYTQLGASEATTEIKPGKEMPEPLGDFKVGVFANWEVDIWHKLRNAKEAAVKRYLASIDGKNFMITNLIAEIATSYYELLSLDTQLAMIKQNIELQQSALRMVRLQKEATKVNELAIKRFEAQILNTKELQYDIHQRIVETENKINYLLGRFPQPIQRAAVDFTTLTPTHFIIESTEQLLANRPDIKQAEQELVAAKLDVAVARANFYPSLGISANFGAQAFNPGHWFKLPESLFATLIGDMVGPLINKKAIQANYLNANAKQIQAIYTYEQTVLKAFIEVVNQLSKVDNLSKRYEVKNQEVKTLNESTVISNKLFASARADYTEVLLTQREALEAKFDLIDTKTLQMIAMIDTYRALGGGWQ